MRVRDIPLVLHTAIDQKDLRAAVARRQLRASDGELIVMYTRPERAAERGPARHVILHVAAREAGVAGIGVVKLATGGYGVKRVPLQFVACSRLPRSLRSVRRIDAAGGVVVKGGARPRVLLLRKKEAKRTRWVLPKGKRRANEPRRHAALREVREEAGLGRVTVGRYLARERYFDVEGKQVVFKQVSYYLMHCSKGNVRLRVNRAEGFSGGRWTLLERALEETSPVRTHASLRRAREVLRG